MLTIAKIFGNSPFALLQTHMHKVGKCMQVLKEVFQAMEDRNEELLSSLVPQLSKLEHEADLTKNDIRNHLPKSIFLPIDRSQFLEILSIQDTIADKTEEIGNLLVLQKLDMTPEFTKLFMKFVEKNIDTFWFVRDILKEMEELIEASFGGKEAQKVKGMIDQTAYAEHESDVMKRDLMQEFYKIAEELPTPTFYLWTKLIDEVGAISHTSERLAMRIRLILET